MTAAIKKLDKEYAARVRADMRRLIALMEQRRVELDAGQINEWHFIGATTMCREELDRLLTILDDEAK